MAKKQNDPTWKATNPNNILELAMPNLASKNRSPIPLILKKSGLKQNKTVGFRIKIETH